MNIINVLKYSIVILVVVPGKWSKYNSYAWILTKLKNTKLALNYNWISTASLLAFHLIYQNSQEGSLSFEQVQQINCLIEYYLQDPDFLLLIWHLLALSFIPPVTYSPQQWKKWLFLMYIMQYSVEKLPVKYSPIPSFPPVLNGNLLCMCECCTFAIGKKDFALPDGTDWY